MGSPDWYDLEPALEILSTFKTWAVVGCSSDPLRDSNSVARYLIGNGYEVVPVNPNEDEVFGLPCYDRLDQIPEPGRIEVVDIFRRPEEAGAHVDEAIDIGAKAIWMQLGVIDEAAAERAKAAGLRVVMDRCPRIDLPRLARN
jgi:predicted CoA-binding protein